MGPLDCSARVDCKGQKFWNKEDCRTLVKSFKGRHKRVGTIKCASVKHIGERIEEDSEDEVDALRGTPSKSAITMDLVDSGTVVLQLVP